MNPSDDRQHDALRDCLLEQALRETLGAESPPDLSDRILAAAESQVSDLPQPKGEPVMERPRKRNWFRTALVVATSFLIGIGATFLYQAAEDAWRSRQATRQLAQLELALHNYHGTMPQSLPTPYYMKDDVGYAATEWATVPAKERGKVSGAPDRLSGLPTLNKTPYVSIPADSKRRSEMDYVADKPVRETRSDSSGLRMMVEPKVIIQAEGEERAFQVFGRTIEGKGLPATHYVSPPVDSEPEVLAKLDGERGIASSEFFLTHPKHSGAYWGTNPTGEGPGRGGDQYVRLVENPFRAVEDHPLSTFSIDVDTASYANVRRFLLQENRLPPPDAVRIEEFVNYFDYDYSGPSGDVPFASHIEVAGCPWAPDRRLVRIGLKGREVQTNQRPPSNLVFLLDVSGSMNSPDKLPLLKAGMKMLAEQLSENDRVAIVVYAGSEGLVLPSTVGDRRAEILDALDRLQAGGSTNGGAGIELAYKIAQENLIKDGVNRVILCTDGDFNVGTTSTAALERLVEDKAKSGIFLSVLGFGRGNLNDAMMETISNKGNGNYAYIDGITEAQKVLVEQMGGTLIAIAKDVKIQVEFNPIQVEAYRLIGYENRILAAEDFNDDTKDAGEIGAGHTVTALYEIVPAGGKVDVPDVDPLRYQLRPQKIENDTVADELLTLKLRYKEPDGDTSELLEFPVSDGDQPFAKASPDFQFAAAVASFGMLLRGSAYQDMTSCDAVLEIAQSAKGPDHHGYRAEFVQMVERARELTTAPQDEPQSDAPEAE